MSDECLCFCNCQEYSRDEDDWQGVVCFSDDKGRDWYETQKLFRSDTTKVCVDSNGNVLHVSSDVDRVCPVEGGSIFETYTPPPTPFSSFEYKFSQADGFVKNTEYENSLKVTRSVYDVETEIEDERQKLEYIEFGVIEGDSTEVRKKIARLLGYKKKLTDVDVTAGEIEWPEKPE